MRGNSSAEIPCPDLRQVEEVGDETVHLAGGPEDGLSQLVDAFSDIAVDGRLEERGAGDNGAERVSQVVRNDGEQLHPSHVERVNAG